MRTLDLTRTCHILVLSFCSEVCFANTWWGMTNTGADMQKCAHLQTSGMVLKVSQTTEYQCFTLCLYTRPCDSFCWRETRRLCELRTSVEKTTDPSLCVHKEYKGKAEPLCMNAKHACAHRPCRSYEVCIPVLAAHHHICLPIADLPGAQDTTSATPTAVDGMTTVLFPPSSTLTSVNQIMSTDVTTSTVETSSSLASETTESPSPLASETTELPSPLASETTESPSPLASETTELPSSLTSETNAASLETSRHTTAESSAPASIRASVVTSAITDRSSAPTSESTQPPITTTSQQLYTYTYLGCYNDSTTRALNESYLESSTMNHNICFKHCWSYKYAGLEFSDECFCDDDLAPGHTLQRNSKCNSACSGNSDETCGGYWYIEIYELVQT